jgi:hypothetical protein
MTAPIPLSKATLYMQMLQYHLPLLDCVDTIFNDPKRNAIMHIYAIVLKKNLVNLNFF